MARTVVRIVVVCAVMLAATACIRSSDNPPLVLRDADSGSTVQMTRGDELRLLLLGNPSTGYVWEVVAIDTAILEPVGEPEFEPEADAAGADGTVTLRFRASGRGQTQLELVHRASFDPSAPPVAMFAVVVIVN